MNCLDSTDRDAVLREPFEVIRDAPHQLTQRVKTLTDAGNERALAVQELDLRAFPSLYPEESQELRLQRLQAFKHTWQAFESNMKAVHDKANEETFDKLGMYVFQMHTDAHKDQRKQSRQRIVPTALAISGSITATDQEETLPMLLQSLRGKECYAALLSGKDLPPGGTVASSLQSILCQFSGLTTDADDMEALLAWYGKEIEGGQREEQKLISAADDILSPLGKMALKTPSKPQKPSDAASNPEVQEADKVLSPFGKLALQTPQTQKLRPRTRRCTEAALKQGEGLKAPCKDGFDTRAKPLVVLIQGTESVDPMQLQDLIIVISENHAELPITLVLGMTTSAAALGQILPADVSDVLAVKSFQLAQALSKLEAVFREVLLSDKHTLWFGKTLVQDLHNHFMHHDFILRSFQQGLQLACLSHFQSCEFSYLISEDSLESCLEDMASSSKKRLLDMLGSSSRRLAALGLLQETQAGITDWKISVKLFQEMAIGTGHRAVADGFSLRELYQAAASPSFSQCTKAQGLIHSIDRGLQQLKDGEAMELLHKLISQSDSQKCSSELHQQLRDSQLSAANHSEEELKARRDSSQHAETTSKAAQGPEMDSLGCRAPFQSVSASHLEQTLAKPQGKENTQSNAGRRHALAKAVQGSKDCGGLAPDLSSTGNAVLELRKILQRISKKLDRTPILLPGSSICCILDDQKLHNQLSFAPRVALDMALANPEAYLGSPESGLCAGQLDTAIAYQLLTEYGEEVDLSDWFSSFCTIFKAKEVVQKEQDGSPPKKQKRGRQRGSRSVYQDKKEHVPEVIKVSGKIAKRSAKQFIDGQAKGNKQKEASGKEAPDAGLTAMTEQSYSIPLVELVSRFTQATNELQLMGIVKNAARRGKGNTAQRMVWAAHTDLANIHSTHQMSSVVSS